MVITAPIPANWAPDDKDAAWGDWKEECQESAKRSLLGRASDIERLLAMYCDMRSVLKQRAAVTDLDRRAASQLLKDRTFEEIRPPLVYFMFLANRGLSEGRSLAWQNIQSFGLTLQTFLKNLGRWKLPILITPLSGRRTPMGVGNRA